MNREKISNDSTDGIWKMKITMTATSLVAMAVIEEEQFFLERKYTRTQ